MTTASAHQRPEAAGGVIPAAGVPANAGADGAATCAGTACGRERVDRGPDSHLVERLEDGAVGTDALRQFTPEALGARKIGVVGSSIVV